MAAKINWHRYGTKLRHCHLMYSASAKKNHQRTHSQNNQEDTVVQLPTAQIRAHKRSGNRSGADRKSSERERSDERGSQNTYRYERERNLRRSCAPVTCSVTDIEIPHHRKYDPSIDGFRIHLRYEILIAKYQRSTTLFTEKCTADVLRYLVSSFTRLGKLAKFFVQHSFELHQTNQN